MSIYLQRAFSVANVLRSARLTYRSGAQPLWQRGSLRQSYASDTSGARVPLFDKLLVANRGEIACRVMRTAQRLGVRTVAIYSEADRNAQHVRQANEAVCVGAAPSDRSYLRAEAVLEAARRCGAKAVHPGYGFLSENAGFAEAVQAAGLCFVGPPAEAIRAMGDKSASKALMEAAGVPVVPGYHGERQEADFLAAEADRVGYPLLIKGVMAGGGKGMRLVESSEQFREALAGAQRETAASFGDSRVLLERYVVAPRHVEIQVVAAQPPTAEQRAAGAQHECVYLHERDCSVQRRYQKVLEEAPAPGLTPELRRRMGEAAVAAARAVNYAGAGTVEFILSASGEFYFMEMNTRLQVEHPVTEMITGTDLVEWQLQVAAGNPLPMRQEEIPLRGHSIEARVYAENPHNNFLPDTGTLELLRPPLADPKYLRVETGVIEGDQVSVFYDPMISKVVVWDEDRASALRRLHNVLGEYHIAGVKTNIPFLRKCLEHPAFKAGGVETGFIPTYIDELIPPIVSPKPEITAQAVLSLLLREELASTEHFESDFTSPWSQSSERGWRMNQLPTRCIKLRAGADDTEIDALVERVADAHWRVTVGDQTMDVRGSISEDGSQIHAMVDGTAQLVSSAIVKDTVYLFSGDEKYEFELDTREFDMGTQHKGSLTSPMPGKVVRVLVKVGDRVEQGDALLVMEAMKMEVCASARGQNSSGLVCMDLRTWIVAMLQPFVSLKFFLFGFCRYSKRSGHRTPVPWSRFTLTKRHWSKPKRICSPSSRTMRGRRMRMRPNNTLKVKPSPDEASREVDRPSGCRIP